MEYSPQRRAFEQIHQETYGKTGCRRVVPGQYLAVDPKGRAVLIGAVRFPASLFLDINSIPPEYCLIHSKVERQKLVYILNRDAQANLTISSPLEAHKNYSICFSIVGIDVGFENPTFACLEIDYEVNCHELS